MTAHGPARAVPALNAADQAWTQALLQACDALPQRMPGFLQQRFFNEAAGRALILQPRQQFGYYYLKAAIHEQPERLAAEIKALLDFCALVARLRQQGLLYVFDGGTAGADAVLFLSDLFQQPKAGSAHVVLNKRGDYSVQPDTILDASDAVLYRGVRIDGDLYLFVQEAVRGIFSMTDDARACLLAACRQGGGAAAGSEQAPPPAALPPPTPTAASPASRLRTLGQHWRAAAGIATALLAGGGSGYGWHHIHHGGAVPPIAVDTGARPAPGPSATPKPDPAPPRLHGVDLSKWNGRNGADVIQEAELAFAFVRASDGMRADPSFQQNWQRLAARGIPHGAYHVFSMASDPTAQARHVLDVVGEVDTQQLCVAVDFEEDGLPPREQRPAVQAVQTALLAHLAYLERRLGCPPIIYTDVSMGNYYLNDARFSRYPLWVADWVSERAPTLPAAWSKTGYRFWQRSRYFTFADHPGEATDLDLFAGSKQQLIQLLRPAVQVASSAAAL
jgi:lysozyme